ncbi:MAG: hypothetical protein FWG14_00080 [Peptococcaceae bacterium]|nr:hypothetical protein [Peptococcaceae bacterium]
MTTTTLERGGVDMGYETKVILKAVAELVRTSKSVEEAFERVVNIANAEGVVIPKPESEKEAKD